MEEFSSVVSEVVGISIQEGVDAVLLAGDVYDGAAPSAEADAIVFDAFVNLSEARIPFVLIPGNHDSPLRLGALGKLVRPLGARVVPRVVPANQGGVVEVPGRNGTEAALVACLPFIPERRFGDAAKLFAASSEWHQNYAEGVAGVLAALEASFRVDRVNIVLAHLFATGAVFGGGEREVSITLNYAVPPSRLPATASYIALGHIHKPQKIAGSPAPARYAGSLLQLDFGEKDQAKSVSIVDALPGRPVAVREVRLAAGRRLVDLVGSSLPELERNAASVGDAFLRVTMNTTGPAPGVADQIRELLPNAVEIRLQYERSASSSDGPSLRSLRPRDQFRAYYRSAHGVDADQAALALFDEILVSVTDEA
jgi:exonuclease SbcD